MPEPLAISAYTYPWDLVGDPDAAPRLAQMGLNSVTIAAAYHSVRASTPRHPQHRIVEARTAALYVPTRAVAWRGSRLSPLPPEGWASADSFSRARDAVESAGLPVRAWVVASHNSAVGAGAPDACGRNAFGDVYRHALCPANIDVTHYVTTLVGEVAAQAGVDSMVIEACGPMGVDHQSSHEKTAGAGWSAVDRALLSVCFCAGCRSQYDQFGIDPDHLARLVRQAVGQGLTAPESAFDEPSATAILTVRRNATHRMRDAAAATARANGITRLSFHASTEAWATGPGAAVVSADSAADEFVAHCWSELSSSADAVSRMAALSGNASTGAYVTILDADPPDSERYFCHWSSLADAGAREIHVYHAGLASTQRLDAAASAMAQLRQLNPA